MKRMTNLLAVVALTCAIGFMGAPQYCAAQMETPLFTFSGGADGALPQAELLMGKHGKLYGTTVEGGDTSHYAYGYGVVFMLDKTGKETVLYTFSGGTDGGNPYAPLILDKKGNLYGTTSSGGAYTHGVVFELSPPKGGGAPWNETVLYSFTGGADGSFPYHSGVVMDKKGNLYGTTNNGGADLYGVVFELSPPVGMGSWTEIVLHTFSGGADGAFPKSGVILDKKGNLYGTTEYGGSANGTSGYGVVFKLSPPVGMGSWTEIVLHTFSGGTDGAFPWAGVIRDSNGNLYGTTREGGNAQNTGYGVVFMVDKTGKETVLYPFGSLPGGADGVDPYAGVILYKDDLYGTTSGGGAQTPPPDGVVYKLSPPVGAVYWTETVLYTFTGGADGGLPEAGVIADGFGNLYGTTTHGGNFNNIQNGAGVVYEITP